MVLIGAIHGESNPKTQRFLEDMQSLFSTLELAAHILSYFLYSKDSSKGNCVTNESVKLSYVISTFYIANLHKKYRFFYLDKIVS